MEKLDKTDRRIVRELQLNGRLSNAELAERVNLSPSPCLRRVRRLEDSGIIKGYSAQIDRERIGLPVYAFVMVKIEKHSEEVISTFEAAIKVCEDIVECHLLTGSHDYLLQVTAESLRGYERFMKETLNRIPGITSVETTFAIDEVKHSALLPA